MSDLRTLADAFAELERRADDRRVDVGAERAVPAATRSRHRPPLVAASAAAVLAIATGGALLAHGAYGGGQQAGAPAAPQPTVAGTPSGAAPAGFDVPSTGAELAERFQSVLRGRATFVVAGTGADLPLTLSSNPSGRHTNAGVKIIARDNDATARPGVAIRGTITAGGRTGGFDLQILPSTTGDAAQCDLPDLATCTVRRLPDGSSLATERVPDGASAVTYALDLVRADGAEIIMHVSNERDPKGAGPVLTDRPPLTIAQMTALGTSDRW